MLVDLKEILKIAEENKSAIGSFNTPNYTSLKAVIDAAEELEQPVIITHAQLHEEMGLCKMEEIAPIMLFAAERAKIPVCLHLDHGTDLDYVKRSMKLGFTSVMYDGSELTEAENFKNTALVVKWAHEAGISVEGEIGTMGARERISTDNGSIYTEPDEAREFAEKTGIDALACAFGAAHGVYAKEPKLDFDRLDKIRQAVSVPLVMHGGSGVSDDDFRHVIKNGIRKVNYYTYMAMAGGKAVRELSDMTYFHDIELAGLIAMKADVKHAISVFSCK
ncbi:MAG: class II fructose-bisphosphate aldolase [Clostridia bacterium]|nr:class II fructose-bisphosphate aldolase [Clostridia bacterium]